MSSFPGQILQPQLSNMIQGNSIMGAGQQQQIVNVTDPNTGKIVQKVVQNTIDPKTGKTVQVTMPIAGQQQQQQIINVTDPDTGQLVQKVVQNTVDPKTGKIVQVATPINSISNTDGKWPLNNISYKYSGVRIYEKTGWKMTE